MVDETSIILVANRRGEIVGGHTVPARRDGAVNARSLLMDRMSLGKHGTSHSSARDYYDTLGYPQELTIDDYLGKYERDPLGAIIVNFPAEETWRDAPTVKDGRDKDATEESAFVAAWDDLAESLRAYHYCARADILAGIGEFGVLLIGVAGAGDLSQPVTRASADDILYLRPYSRHAVDVRSYETDPESPRFGLPLLYELALSDVGSLDNVRPTTATRKIPVHHSRVIHIAEGLLENEIYGRPRLQRVYNLLDDVLKVVGGSAEATWKLMRKGFVLNVRDPNTKITEDSAQNLEQQFDEYDHGLRRYIRAKGMEVHDLGSEVVDPSGLFDVIIALIAAATRIPQRILLGSERGELASSQDGANWAGHIASRQVNFAEPVILRALINRLMGWGALPQPDAGNYSAVWEPLFEMNAIEKAKEAQVWADAAQRAANAFGQPAFTLEEFRREWTPFTEQMEGTPGVPRPENGNGPGQMPGDDVLDQVGEVVSNHGYNSNEQRAIVTAAARLLSRGG